MLVERNLVQVLYINFQGSYFYVIELNKIFYIGLLFIFIFLHCGTFT